MRFPLPLILPLAAPALIGAAPATPPTWERIFDGRTLAGWTPKITGHAAGEDPRHTFVVRNGAIRVSYAGYEKFGGEFGHLFWKAPLGAYRIRFDYRMSGPSLTDIERWQHRNSGIMFAAQAPDTMATGQQFPVSLEFQLLGFPRPDREPTGAVCTPGTTVVYERRRDPRHCIPSQGPVVPVGRWTRVELEVLPSGEITHFIDGKPVLHYAAPELDPDDKDAQPLLARAHGERALRRGYIALQSEGQPLEFRNIELQRLN